MKLKLLLFSCIVWFQLGLSQEIYFHFGNNFTTYDYKNSLGNFNGNIKSSSGSAYELGYNYSFKDKFTYSGSLVWDQYNAKGSNGVSLYAWNTNYLGIQNAISYAVLKTRSELEINLKAGVTTSFIANGQQLLNNRYYDLTQYEEFKGIVIQPLIGMQVKYLVNDYFGVSLNYIFSKSLPKSGLESLSFNTNQVQLGFYFPL